MKLSEKVIKTWISQKNSKYYFVHERIPNFRKVDCVQLLQIVMIVAHNMHSSDLRSPSDALGVLIINIIVIIKVLLHVTVYTVVNKPCCNDLLFYKYSYTQAELSYN